MYANKQTKKNLNSTSRMVDKNILVKNVTMHGCYILLFYTKQLVFIDFYNMHRNIGFKAIPELAMYIYNHVSSL